MKKKYNEGFSLVETLVAMAILALIVIPVCSGMIMSFRMNAKADELMQAQLAVSSAVETLMAEGIPNGTTDTQDDEDYGDNGTEDHFPNVIIKVKKSDDGTYYTVTATSAQEPDVSVTTSIRAVEPEGGDT